MVGKARLEDDESSHAYSDSELMGGRHWVDHRSQDLEGLEGQHVSITHYMVCGFEQ